MKKRAVILIILLAALLCGCAGSGRAASAAGVSDASPSEAATAEPTAAPTAAPTAVPTAEPTPEPTAVPTVTAGSLVLDPETAEADLSGITEEAEAETAIRALIEGAPILRSLRAVELGERVPPYELYRELSEAYPEAEIRLSLTLAGESVGRDAKVLDLHAMDAADTPELLRVLPYLDGPEEINFVSEETGECVYTLENIGQLDRVREAAPGVKLRVAFRLFGKRVTSEDERIEYLHKKIGNEGVEKIRSVLPYLSSCTYFLMDDCGVDNEVMARLREDFPDTKVVWRVWITKPNYKNKRALRRCSFLTDTTRIRTTYIRPKNCGVLKYCTETKYIDFGHNRYMSDFWFLSYMPKLEVCILSQTGAADLAPFANCPELEFLEVFTTDIKTLEPLSHCKKLQYLNIAYCTKLKDITALYELTNLKVLRMINTPQVPGTQKREVAKRLPDCKILKGDLDNPTGGGWRKGARYKLLRQQMEYDIDRRVYGIP